MNTPFGNNPGVNLLAMVSPITQDAMSVDWSQAWGRKKPREDNPQFHKKKRRNRMARKNARRARKKQR